MAIIGAGSISSTATLMNRDTRGEMSFVDELALDVAKSALALVDEDDPLRLGAGDLAAELGTDRPAGPSHEHGPAREVRIDRLEVDLDRLASEQVLDLDGANLDGEIAVAGDQLVQPRQRLHCDVLGARHLDDPGTLVAGSRGGRDQKLVGPAVAQDAAQLL